MALTLFCAPVCDVCVADNVCLRPWAFERVPNKMIRGLDNVLIYTSTKETCLAACLNEVSDSASIRSEYQMQNK
jgi:hypothetical protein